MGKLSIALVALGVAACGSDNNNPADAKVVIVPDAKMIDAPKVFNDAPPVNYDFSCFGSAAPTTAADPVTIAGTTETVNVQSQMLEGVGGVTVESFAVGSDTAVNTVTSASSGTVGSFATGGLVTGGHPLDGYIKASKATFRTTYLYPPSPLVANEAGIPVPILDETTFGLLLQFVIMGTQNDTNNGVLLVQVTDCAATPAGVDGATISVKAGSTEVGTQYEFSMFAPGTFIVLDVPDGNVTVTAAYNSMTFPGRAVAAHKKATTPGATGTITATVVRPGPL
jgi:hypothetical protein